MPFPNPATQFKKGQSGNPGGRAKKPDIEALNRLIEEQGAEGRIAITWLISALGDLKKGIKPDNQLFKLLIEYRNGKVPDQINLTHDDGDQEAKRINVPDVDERSKGRARRRAAGPKGKGGDVSS